MKKIVKESLNEKIENRNEVTDTAYPYWFAIKEIKQYCNQVIEDAEENFDRLENQKDDTARIAMEHDISIVKDILEIIDNI